MAISSQKRCVIASDMPISQLKPYAKNSRTHPKHQVDALASAIKHFGFTQPIVIDENCTILAGHGRYYAAQLLKLEEVPVRIVEGLSEHDKKAYIIADNKISEQSSWDETLLTQELADLESFVADDALSALLDINTFATHKIEQVGIDSIKPHPRNYKNHPADQLEHLKKSIADHGIYRNVIVSSDNIILAGHGITLAAREMGLTSIPILRLPIKSNSIHAIKLIAADNEVSHLGENDDRALTEILKEIMENSDLLGTGYDEKMLANLLYVTRPASEIKSIDHAKEWVGMPEYESEEESHRIIVQFKTIEDKKAFCELCGYKFTEKSRDSQWFPFRERRDMSSVKFEED